MLLLATTQHTGSLIGINKQETHSTAIYGSPTDRRCFSYLANSMAVGSRVGVTELSFPVFRDIHLAPKTSVIYNSILSQLYGRRSPGWRYYKSCTQNFCHLQFCDVHLAPKTFVVYNSSSSQASLYPASQIFQSIYHCLPSPLPSRPSQCTLIMLLLVTTQHTCSKKIGTNKRKPRGHLPLTRIKPRFRGARRTTLPFHTYPILWPRVPGLALSNSHSRVPSYTSCTQNFPALQFHPALELASFTLPGSQKVSKHLSLPSIPATFAPFPMQINYALLSDNSPHKFERIGNAD
jgi:hypothetical protein